MQVEKQCCNLEQAKRLKELGVAQEAVFYWHPSIGYPVLGGRLVTKTGYRYSKIPIKDDKQTAALFTVAELGEMLPAGYDTMKITVVQNEYTWQGYDYDGQDCSDGTFETEAQCRAAMLIHLIENKLITVQEINTRLMAG